MTISLPLASSSRAPELGLLADPVKRVRSLISTAVSSVLFTVAFTEFFNGERDEKIDCKVRHGGQVLFDFHITILYIFSIYVSFVKLFV